MWSRRPLALSTWRKIARGAQKKARLSEPEPIMVITLPLLIFKLSAAHRAL